MAFNRIIHWSFYLTIHMVLLLINYSLSTLRLKFHNGYYH